MPSKHKLTSDQVAKVYGKFGHPKGGLSIHDIQTGEKTRVKKPDFVKHLQRRKNGSKREVIVARGTNIEGHNVSQIVHSEEVS